MRAPTRLAALGLLALLALLLSPPMAQAAVAQTADEVVSRYVTARGGLEAWKKVNSLRMAGTYTTFSQEQPMRLIWRRPNLFRFETNYLDGPVAFGHDGKELWWSLHFADEGKIGKPDQPQEALLDQQMETEPLLIDYAAKGHKVELVGRGAIDGQTTVDLKVTRKDGLVETWHLDPSTYLEVAVDSTVYDMTQKADPMAQRAYFSDFKKVGEILLPHRIEKEYGARYALLTILEVQINPVLPESAFAPRGPDKG